VLSLVADGTSIDLSALTSATKANAQYLTDIDGQDGPTDSATHFLTLSLGAYPPVAGTYSCGTDGVDVSYTSNGQTFSAGVNSAGLRDTRATSCTITVTSYAAAGAVFEGTFTGRLIPNNSSAAALTMTDGQFKLTAP
jgi:hypothetical protein